MDYNISYRKKDGSIQCIISYKDSNGKWKTKSKQGFKTQKESKPWQSKIIEELKSTVKIKDEHKDITYKDFKEMYLEGILATKSYNTYLAYENALNKFDFDKMLIDIKYVDIKDIALKLIKDHSTDTVRKYVSTLSVMFESAKDEYEIILVNPLAGKKVIDKEKKDRKIKALTKSQSKDLLDKMYLHGKDYVITIIALHTGMRVGEIAGLTVKDIDFKNQLIDVNKQWKRFDDGYGFGKLKSSNSYRKIPLSPLLKKELQKYVKVININGRLFPENTNNISERLSYRFNRLGFDISMHDLRHTYATTLLSNGVDIKTVAEFMGDNVETIIKTYIHFTDDMLDKGKEMIKNIF